MEWKPASLDGIRYKLDVWKLQKKMIFLLGKANNYK